MKHTDAQIEQTALRFEQLADALDPAEASVEQIEDLRQIGVVAQGIQEQEARLREAVNLARAHGRSWNQIAVTLGVSRQAARQRFAA